MKLGLIILGIILLSITSMGSAEVASHQTSDKFGAICLGPDLSMAGVDYDIFISVDWKKKKFSGEQGHIAFDDLELNKKHIVRLFKGNKQFQSFKIDFRKLKSNFVVVWKAAGYWKSMSVGGEKCEWPVPGCPKGYGCP